MKTPEYALQEWVEDSIFFEEVPMAWFGDNGFPFGRSPGVYGNPCFFTRKKYEEFCTLLHRFYIRYNVSAGIPTLTIDFNAQASILFSPTNMIRFANIREVHAVLIQSLYDWGQAKVEIQ